MVDGPIGAVAVGAFAALIALEFVATGRWPTPLELLLEVLEVALLLAATVGWPPMAARLRGNRRRAPHALRAPPSRVPHAEAASPGSCGADGGNETASAQRVPLN
jgi:hypothetical protein